MTLAEAKASGAVFALLADYEGEETEAAIHAEAVVRRPSDGETRLFSVLWEGRYVGALWFPRPAPEEKSDADTK
jgi:hypothetical protein